MASVLGLRTVIYHVSDLKRAKEWYSSAFGLQPYFDEPFYVGFNIGGYELGLDPDPKGAKPGGGSVSSKRRSMRRGRGGWSMPARARISKPSERRSRSKCSCSMASSSTGSATMPS
jgi:catechol 2,3-dioxygenase-like lactoylglutathione lyase family enzyme